MRSAAEPSNGNRHLVRLQGRPAREVTTPEVYWHAFGLTSIWSPMASKGQRTGMRAVYQVAAELVSRGLTVSTTSRSAVGADLLVTDESCQTAFSVQVKANSRPAGFWLVGEKAKRLKSRTHVYVFVNFNDNSQKHEYYVVPSKVVRKGTRDDFSKRSGTPWYSFYRSDAEAYRDAWRIFGCKTPE
jgi:hypothetical protein